MTVARGAHRFPYPFFVGNNVPFFGNDIPPSLALNNQGELGGRNSMSMNWR